MGRRKKISSLQDLNCIIQNELVKFKSLNGLPEKKIGPFECVNCIIAKKSAPFKYLNEPPKKIQTI